ncbi:hypothetical protein [Xanthocytophaga agilis]|uniref:Uncharacterized protein n=1 Tax=Xanthocytophaga agilis TaxID=3048010 RepID=A0AAE3R421_9BACT|nr:hypothetical protein [Xanthocytophaga agilis]MDJ1500483.1 hypothetical protein [Xanthocytophaga agilis]
MVKTKTNEKPLALKVELVKQVYKNEKTQTRRLFANDLIINQDPNRYRLDGLFNLEEDKQSHIKKDGLYACFHDLKLDVSVEPILCPYGKKGDLLWVREPWAKVPRTAYWHDPTIPHIEKDSWWYIFKASWERSTAGFSWKSSRFMPKEAARTWLRIKDVKVERLHSISTEDIKAEGVRVPVSERGGVLFVLGKADSPFKFMPESYQNGSKEGVTEHDFMFAHWASLWCEIHGKANWLFNPWVWVIEFEIVAYSN